MAGRLSGLFNPTTLGITALAGGIAAIGKSAIDAALEFEKANAAIVAGTGATGAALEGLQADFEEVFQAVPEGAEEVGTALADVNTALGLTGEPLQRLTEQMIDLGRVTGEGAAAFGPALQALNNWGSAIDDQSVALDQMLVASQATGIGIGDLASQMSQFGAQFRGVGLSFEESLAILGAFDKAGIETSRTMRGLRQAFAEFADAGRDPVTAFQETVAEIESLESPVEAAKLAMETFGDTAGQQLADAIRSGTLATEDLVGALGEADGAIARTAEETATFGERWDEVRKPLDLALASLGTTFLDAMEQNEEAIQALIQGVAGFVEGLGDFITWLHRTDQAATQWRDRITEAVRSAGEAFGNWVSGVIEAAGRVIENIGGLGSAFGEAMTRVVEVARSTADAVRQAFINLGAGVAERVRGLAERIVAPFAWAKEQLVGNSIIPELIDGIGLQFQRLDEEMVQPAEQAANAVNASFASIQTPNFVPTVAESAAAGRLSQGPTGVGRLWVQIQEALGGTAGAIEAGGRAVVDVLRSLEGGFESAAQAITRAVGNIVTQIGSAIPGIGGAVTGLIGTLVNWISSLFRDEPSEQDRLQEALRNQLEAQISQIRVLDPGSGITGALQEFAIRTGDLLLNMGLDAQTVSRGILDNLDLIQSVFEEGGDRSEAMRLVLEKMQEDFQRAEEGLGESADAIDDVSSSLRNAVEGFKIEALRFGATVPGLGPRSSIPGTDLANVAGATTGINVEGDLNINSAPGESGEELLGKIETAATQRRWRGGGGLALGPHGAVIR